MDKENNIVYVKTKNGIYKCYKSEQMHKPIYYPVESKTNGYIDYYDAIRILNIDDLYEQCKKQKEVINKITDLIKQYGKYDGEKCTRGFQMWSADFNKILDMLKEVSE